MGSQLFYMPWTPGKDNVAPAMEVARRMAQREGRRLSVYVAHKGHMQDRFPGVNLASSRGSGYSNDDFLVALHPSVKMMTRIAGASALRMVIEFAHAEFESWGEVSRALNIVTGETMADSRPESIRKLHDEIENMSYNGFTSRPGSSVIEGQLKGLLSAGWLDDRGQKFLLSVMAESRSDTSLTDLQRIIKRVVSTPPERPRVVASPGW